VRVDRQADLLHLTLARPEVHNALNTRMRDELYEAFTLAASDPAVRVLLDGDGPSFCAGGDLDEFGSRPDPATAHVVRLQRSVGRLIASVADRVKVVLHGACMGSGIELPAFAGRVAARPDARIGLPEVGLGLIPGAGGTTSVTRRIGRHRTAYLALTGDCIDARTALEWGLVDELYP
jgi:enoyl-CoA hydratase/carnithine racemase